MERGKRAQFYLIAAVLISAVIIAIVTVKNYVGVQKEPESFYDVSSQIKDEAAKVIDYGVINSQDKMSDFALNISESLRKTDPGIKAILIFGNETGVTVMNFGNTTAQIGDTIIPGANEDVESNILLNVGGNEFKKQESVKQSLFTNDWMNNTMKIDQTKKDVVVKLNGQEYVFKLYEYQQFFMIIKKGEGGEGYVEVK